MAKQCQVKSRRKLLNPLFHLQTKAEDDGKMSVALLKNARKTGQLNLSGRNLQTIPERLWTLYEPGGDETSINYDLCKNDEQPWWNYQTLQNLDLSSNCLTEIQGCIEMFGDLQVLNLQDNNITCLPPEISQLTKLTKLNLSHNKLTIIPECVYQLTELRTLLLPYNNIDTVSKDISDLVMLQQLVNKEQLFLGNIINFILQDLSHNKIIDLPSGMGYLVRLTQANFSHNKLIELPPDIVNMRVLIKLDLTHNELVTLPKLGELRKLQMLYANHNNIEAIPDCEGCECLQELHFGNNYIKEITTEFCESMSHLRILDLRDNKIEVLPDTISNLQHLIRLDLTNNNLTNLPNSLSLLAHLQSLQLEGNKIRSIRRDIIQCGTSRILKSLRERQQAESMDAIPPGSDLKSVPELHDFPDMYAMRNARALNITMKELTTVPDDVFIEAAKAEITSVDLCKNKLKEVPKGLLTLAEAVTELNFSVNLLTAAPDFLVQFTRLHYLNLSGNAILNLPSCFKDLKYLRELVISNNKFVTIPDCVYDMESLEILLARDNQINHIDVPNLTKLKFLTVLDFANNNLDYIPPELGNLTHIRSLEINGNSFRQPRYAILAKGTDTILAYLRDRIPN